MYVKFLSVFLGIALAATTQLAFPNSGYWLLIAPLVAALCWPRVRLIGAYFCLGFAFTMLRAALILSQQLPLDQSKALFWIEGSVAEVLIASADNHDPELVIMQGVVARKYSREEISLSRLQISSFGAPRPELAQKCGFFARLKAPYSTRNPGSRNKHQDYFVRRIGATGYMVQHPANYCESQTVYSWLPKVRIRVAQALDESTLEPATIAVFKALSLADRKTLTESQREVFRDSGTVHLLAISGLHISFIAGACYLVVRSLLLVCVGTRYGAGVHQCSLLAALVGGYCYASLAGFTLPTQRAFIVILVATLGALRHRQVLSWSTFCWSLMGVLVIDPFSLLTIGFWLSFAAVAVLIVLRARHIHAPWWQLALRSHIYLSLASLPLVIQLTAAVPIVSPVANFLAVPVMCFAVIPTLLLGVVMLLCGLPGFELLWQLAAVCWQCLSAVLTWSVANVPAIPLPYSPSQVQLMLAALGVITGVIPLFPGRWLFVGVCCGQLFLPFGNRLQNGEFRLTSLDVGQGLAVIVETKNHVLVYDTGPAFRRYSSGAAIVAPALRHLGIGVVQRVIVSHADNDHAGGLPGLLQAMPIENLSLAEPDSDYPNAEVCRAGQFWSWDEVSFEIISPLKNATGSRNDLSCVLRVSSHYGSALLPGDIEAQTETHLVDAAHRLLRADVLFAPHHGSASSSTQRFVNAVAPKYVIYSAGLYNRFGFPNAHVEARYTEIGATGFVTSELGAITLRFTDQGITLRTARFRPLRWRQ
ncbi:MAG: DNA internalization-related competence protein ComEC/Rec2 [Pseudomonadota bacterium]